MPDTVTLTVDGREYKEYEWMTPHGHPATFRYRDGTNDFGVIQGILIHDEYGVPDGLTGTAVDVGAHVGAWTVAVALDNPDLRVIAIEPVPPNVALLRVNVERNGLTDRVTVLEALAGQRKGSAYVSWTDVGDDVHRYIGNQRGIPGDRHKVPTVTLASLATDVRLMKMDCEGCEYGFLASAAVGRVAEIVGEYHEAPPVLTTHDVTASDTSERLGHFRAVRR